jgi:D-tyrosyl-tRNA(Tyr) deacylase
VQSGIFAADMDVSLTNWGPVTLILDSTPRDSGGKQ